MSTEKKQILLLAIIAIMSFSAVLISMIYIVQNEPEWLGLPPNPADTMAPPEVVELEQTYEITKHRLETMQHEMATLDSINRLRDSLGLIIKKFQQEDSLQLKTIADYKDSILPEAQLQATNSKTFADSASSSYTRMKNDYTKIQNQVDLAHKQINSQSAVIKQQSDSVRQENFKAFAKIYNNAKPAEVAKILEVMEAEDAAQILKLMSKKKAGKVIEALTPERAALINLMSK